MGIEPATHSTILRAAEALRDGKLVAFPTETVYGLGADATNADAVARVFEMKGRPRFNPLIVHLPDLDAAKAHAAFNAAAEKLAVAFWPGPLTLVLPKHKDSAICDLVSAGLETIAVRVPKHAVAQELMREAACPIAAPSANKAGHISPTTAEHVENDLGDGPEIILDGGFSSLGLESTVVDLSGEEPLLLRPGAISREKIENLLGAGLGQATENDAPASPGQLNSHYAPHAKVRLEANSVEPGEALLAFGDEVPQTEGPVINLSPDGNLREAAIHFFAALRELDASGCKTIAVMHIPNAGLGEAINDRLRRAAAPRGE